MIQKRINEFLLYFKISPQRSFSLCFSHVKLIFLNYSRIRGNCDAYICLNTLPKVRYSVMQRNYNYQNLEMSIVNIYHLIHRLYSNSSTFYRKLYCSKRKLQDHAIAFSCHVSFVSFNPEQHQSLCFMALKLSNSPG